MEVLFGRAMRTPKVSDVRGREYQRWHIVQEMKQWSEIPVCNFNLLHLVAGSGHLRSSPKNILCSRITSLLHFHHQQELLGDVIQVHQWQTLRNPFRALGSLCITRWAPVFDRRCISPASILPLIGLCDADAQWKVLLYGTGLGLYLSTICVISL